MTAQATRTNIPAVLQEQGRKITWFCDAVGISVSSYHMRERGERPISGEYLRRAAKVLGVSEAVVRGEEEMEKPIHPCEPAPEPPPVVPTPEQLRWARRDKRERADERRRKGGE